MGDCKEAEYVSVAVDEPGKRTANNMNSNSSGRATSLRAHTVKCVKRRTTLEKILLSILVIVVIFMLFLVIGLILSQKGSDVCLSKECVAAAGSLLENMDPEADPCQDFYQYACGGWMKKTTIPEDKAELTVLNQLEDRLLVLTRGLLEETMPANNSNTAESKARDLYESCTDEVSVEARDVEPLLRFLDDLGGWPIISDDWDEDSWNLEETLAKIRLENDVNFLFTQRVMRDIKNSTSLLLFINQPYMGMKSRDHYLRGKNDKMVRAYLKFMVSIISELRPGLNESTVESEMEEAYELEKQLANASLPLAQRRVISQVYAKLTVGELTELAPQVDWLRYFRLVFENETIDNAEELFTFALKYIPAMGEIVGRTPKRVMANLFMWRVTLRSMEYLSQRLRQHELEYLRVVEGKTTHQPRWRACVSRCNILMGSAVGAMFVRQHFDEQSKIEARKMVSNIRAILMDVLRDNEWMDDQTKERALEKAESMAEMIGYHPVLKDPEAVNREFESVNISRSMLFRNIIELRRNSAQLMMVLLRHHRWLNDKELFDKSPVEVNAYYQNAYNRIYFAAGILQPPFYSKNNLKAMNYGGIGMVIGHEMTHGFDDKGKIFDKDGKLNEWFSKESTKAFNEKKQCLISHYSNFTEIQDGKKVNLNGVLTQGETIADNGGLKDAFLAYRTWVARRGSEEPELPGLGLTNNQVFFLNFGQIWCSLYRPQSLNHALTVKIHPPNHLRVKGAVMNSHHFAEAYNCPVGSPMNPKDKCKIW